MKVLTIAVPSYNSEAYLEKCIQTLAVDDRVEVLIVDDGSTDSTPQLADRLASLQPSVIKVIHKENGGHGSAVNTGMDHATGAYFKVVDSDDWVNSEILIRILDFLEKCMVDQKELDLLISNFIYDKVGKAHKKEMEYRHALPVDEFFSWNEIGRFPKGEYILMHSVIFKTAMLRESGMRLPEHCFYVDNIYVFEPLPYVKTAYYMDLPLYHYFIGRRDQSVNQEVMTKRLDQQARVNKQMIRYYCKPETRQMLMAYPRLNSYMYNYLEIITTVTGVLAICSENPEKIAIKDDVWEYMHEVSPALYHKMKHSYLGAAQQTKTKVSHDFIRLQYKIVNKVYNFN